MNISNAAFEHRRGLHATRGFALFTALIFLLVLTVIGVAMFGDVGMQQRMAGNAQQKARALAAAGNAVGVAQNYLLANVTVTDPDCSGLTTVPRVCLYGSLSDPADDSVWTGGSAVAVQLDGTDFAGTISSAGGVEGAYAAFPEYYIERVPNIPLVPGYSIGLGQQYGATPPVALFRINAWGLGGNTSAVAVVQSIYRQ
ncbi:MAG: pilus assembly PilX family protein [Gammaproteobacteria bacterium]